MMIKLITLYIKNKLIGVAEQCFSSLNRFVSDQRISEILVGSVWVLVARVTAVCLGIISSVLIVRFYGADILGIVTILNSFIAFVTIFSVLGTDTSILRLIPECLTKYSPASAYRQYRRMLGLVIVASAAIGMLLFFYADLISEKIFSKPNLSDYFAMAAIFTVFKSLEILNTQALRGLRLIRAFAFLQVLPQVSLIMLLFMLGGLSTMSDIPVYSQLGAFAVTGLTGWVIMEYAFKNQITSSSSSGIEGPSFSEILTISFPMLITTLLVFVVNQGSILILGAFRSESEVGYYAVAVKLANLAVFTMNIINSMVAPKFSELFHSGKIEELFYVAKRSARLIFWFTAPALGLLVLFGKPILVSIFGKEFDAVYTALVVLALGQFVNSSSGATGIFMNMTGSQVLLAMIMSGVAIVSIGLAFVLVPPLGFNGAAIASAVGMVLWNIITLSYIKVKYGMTTGYFPVPYMNRSRIS